MMIVITIVFLNTALVNAEYKDVNYTTDTTIPGLEYLGCGYNAAGSVDCKESDNCGIDLNFKNPVLRFEWENGIQNLNNTLEWVHPKNTYIWNYPNCFFAEHTSQKSSASSLSKLVDSNLSVDLINLNGNVTSEKNSLDKAQSQRRLKEAYCSVFVAGTFLNEYSDLTMGFTTEIKRLKDAIANGRKNGCSYKLYGKRICARVIGEWRTFFDNFGTHIITRIVLGGKMRMSKLLDSTKDAKQSKLDAGIKADFDSKNVKVKAEANLGKNQSLENNNNSRGNEFTLEGGNMTDTSHLKLDVWSKSLKEAPIPIKVVLTSYVQFFENLELGKEYIQAMNILVVKSDKRRNLRT